MSADKLDGLMSPVISNIVVEPDALETVHYIKGSNAVVETHIVDADDCFDVRDQQLHELRSMKRLLALSLIVSGASILRA